LLKFTIGFRVPSFENNSKLVALGDRVIYRDQSSLLLIGSNCVCLLKFPSYSINTDPIFKYSNRTYNTDHLFLRYEIHAIQKAKLKMMETSGEISKKKTVIEVELMESNNVTSSTGDLDDEINST
jgi:hypothetical protein